MLCVRQSLIIIVWQISCEREDLFHPIAEATEIAETKRILRAQHIVQEKFLSSGFWNQWPSTISLASKEPADAAVWPINSKKLMKSLQFINLKQTWLH